VAEPTPWTLVMPMVDSIMRMALRASGWRSTTSTFLFFSSPWSL